jgi:7,8-dihydropterin-6-yl-methyl-4-(beta-D-ribofuranosyl)aminobenzene 5'-phosphate synthase
MKITILYDNTLFQKNLDVICPAHCTQHIAEIKALYPEKYTEGGVGKIIEL